MERPLNRLASTAAVGAGMIVLALGFLGQERVASSAAAAQSKPASSAVSVSGVTLRSVNLDFPDSDRMFEGAGADVVNNNCLSCHSAGMVLTQPRLPRAVWQAEVEKMRNTYKAPVDEKDVPAIADYLATLPR
jgi:cytochrome c5